MDVSLNMILNGIHFQCYFCHLYVSITPLNSPIQKDICCILENSIASTSLSVN